MRVITVKIKMKKGLRPQKKIIIFETYIVFQFFRLTQPTEQCTVTCFFYRLTQPNEQCTVTCFFSFLLTLIRVASQPTLKELLVGILTLLRVALVSKCQLLFKTVLHHDALTLIKRACQPLPKEGLFVFKTPTSRGRGGWG